MKRLILFLVAGMLSIVLYSQEEEGQSRESMAVDATATQWSFQFGYRIITRTSCRMGVPVQKEWIIMPN